MSKKIEYTDGVGIPHSSFKDEFLAHKKTSEWWYTTGIVTDEENNLYAFQFTITKMKIVGIPFHMLITSVTDIANHKHYYGQHTAFFNKGIVTTSTKSKFKDIASVSYAPNSFCDFGKMNLSIKDKDYELTLQLDAQKAPVWNCEDGKLWMGRTDDPKQVTYYFSITNMLAIGQLVLNGKKLNVKGKGWFDKQGGTYETANPKTHWEWFSFRFFDNEEIMLFAFPQGRYFDGTYVKQSGDYERLNNYNVEPHEIITEATTKYKFSYGWTITMPGIKEETYKIKPKIDGQFNVSFYEIMADVFNNNNELVGYCIVELLPGVLNKKINPLRSFK
ncbi:lipocalin-like domain-containing protein [Neptunitalea lumnitzerae]|uniref:AttH domain-containing protein n=1 Tax=Neptunitalea lumnitzerae TaxID=2965509 RepID=A0ABQ5MKV6_9FLAO|nr:lipocalin-like domain-containing protein [Neptunitalea sp. Y10]GLB49572.1 hypothetical protein Y10_19400 [Neptunitalea sp. Y10]